MNQSDATRLAHWASVARRWADRLLDSWLLLLVSLASLVAMTRYAALNAVSSEDPRPADQIRLSLAYRIDFDVYRIGGQVWASGGDLYGVLPTTEVGANLPFTYPPIAAILFSPLGMISMWKGSLAFTIATVAALLLVVWLVLRELSPVRGRALLSSSALVAVAFMETEPVWRTLGFGQVNGYLMALVVVDVLVGRGRWWQGSLVGLAIAIKLTPAVFLAYFLMRRDYRALVMTVGAALLYTGIGFALAWRDSIEYWTHALRDPSRIGNLGYVGNQSINGALYRLSGGEGLPVVWFVACAVIGLGTLPLLRRLFRQGQDVAAMAVLGLYALLASPVSWTHHWVWFVPATLVLFAWAVRLPGGQLRGASSEGASAQGSPLRSVLQWVCLAAAVGGFVLFSLRVPWSVPYADNEVLPWTWSQHLVGNSYVWWALAFLVIAWVCSSPRAALGSAARSPVGSSA